MQFNIPAEFKNASGVYIIRNTVNSKVYVGSASKLRRRFYEHLSNLKRESHRSAALLELVEKSGLECLMFELLEVTEPSKEAIISCEQKWLDYYKPYENDKGFNFLSIAGTSLGCKQTLETRAKLSALKTGLKASDETKRKMSEAARGRKCTAETKARMSNAQRNRSQETLGKLATAKTGTRHSKESLAKMSAAAKGRKHTEETKGKISEISRKARCENPENYPSQKGRLFSAQHRQRLSEAARGRTLSDEHRQKLKDAWVLRAKREKAPKQGD